MMETPGLQELYGIVLLELDELEGSVWCFPRIGSDLIEELLVVRFFNPPAQ